MRFFFLSIRINMMGAVAAAVAAAMVATSGLVRGCQGKEVLPPSFSMEPRSLQQVDGGVVAGLSPNCSVGLVGFRKCLSAFSFPEEDCFACAVASFPLLPDSASNQTTIRCSYLRDAYCNATASCMCLQYCNGPFLALARCQIKNPEYKEIYNGNCTILGPNNNSTNCSALQNLPDTSSAMSGFYVPAGVIATIVIMALV
jgi:hypothetical protein